MKIFPALYNESQARYGGNELKMDQSFWSYRKTGSPTHGRSFSLRIKYNSGFLSGWCYIILPISAVRYSWIYILQRYLNNRMVREFSTISRKIHLDRTRSIWNDIPYIFYDQCETSQYCLFKKCLISSTLKACINIKYRRDSGQYNRLWRTCFRYFWYFLTISIPTKTKKFEKKRKNETRTGVEKMEIFEASRR